jgi:hypothetical protein
MKRIGAAVVAEHIPDRCPPAAGPKQADDLCQSAVLVKPVKRGGTYSKVESLFLELSILKCGDEYSQRLAWVILVEEIGEPLVRLYDGPWISAEFEQPAGCLAGPRANLESRNVST